MKEWEVIIPIAGHAMIYVKAETEDEAIETAFNIVSRDDIEEWEALNQFNTGNVCYCPRPWEVEVREVDDE